MDKNYNIVLNAEESFARAVGLGVHVKRPLTTWHFLLPGMFIFDFLRRSSETRRYSNLFLFPRKLALDGALDILNGEDRKNILSRIEEEIRLWLTSLKLYSERLLRRHTEEIDLLIDHYYKLLHAEGNNYHTLVKNAYKTREHYEAYLHQLAAAEQEVDQAIGEIHGEAGDIWERLRAEQVQVKELKEKEVNQIFSGAR
jgi:signal transduction histidine kinase